MEGISSRHRDVRRYRMSNSFQDTDVTWHHKDQPEQLHLVSRKHHTAPDPVEENPHPGGTGGYLQWGKE
ncbi:HNH endonuclease [Ochrobactrum sp. BTU1]|uniref:HNH endonuclease n=1 Tax=Ochrobactrum sp. BTU1 TaxID=2840456 RepID=UPI0040451CEF